MSFTQVSTITDLRHRRDKPKLVPITSIIELSPSELSPDEPATILEKTFEFQKRHDFVHEGQGWEIREVTSSEDNDPLYIAQWKVRLIRIWGLGTVISASINVCHALIVYKTLNSIVREDSMSYVLAFTILVYAISFASFLASILLAAAHVYALWGPWVKTLRLVGDDVPTVDVVITCCKEPLDVIQDTILGTLAIDYPAQRYRLVVTDDGNSAELRDWVASLKCDRLYYTARPRPSIPDFKAGNLNHAIAFMATLPGGPARYIASLDADMIPEKRWLRAVLPQILADPKLGVACPSQSFYHTPANDILCQNGRDTWNLDGVFRGLVHCAINSGSGFIVRREAILDIGGFPTTSLLEDTFSSTLMLTKGWHTLHMSEGLQYGLVPGSYWASVKQLVRWQIGGVQMCMHFKYFLSKRLCGALTWQQRLCAFSMIWTLYILPFVDTAMMVVMPLHTAFVGAPIVFRDLETAKTLIRLLCATTLWNWVCDHKRTLVCSYRALNRTKITTSYMAPYYVVGFMRSFHLPRWLGGTKPRFAASGSIANALYERDPVKRAPFLARAKTMLFDYGVLFHVGVIATTILGHAYASYRIYLETTPETFYSEFLRTIAWTLPSTAHVLLSCSVPINYMFSPPDVGDRVKSMGKRDEMGARYADKTMTEEYIDRWHFGPSEAYDIVIIGYASLLIATYLI
ncbi:nucleotide-diphospho-sugar transferase [Thozetella sp. PMI_491]|nr:nucleotide-diphospho-sugar transferase [Thozetella sp. PMI_491]